MEEEGNEKMEQRMTNTLERMYEGNAIDKEYKLVIETLKTQR